MVKRIILFTSYKVIEKGNYYDIVLIEKYPCNSKEELHARERHYSQTIPCVNKINNQGLFNGLGKTQYNKQYNEQHKEEQYKKYCEEHKDQLKEYKQHYYEQHKDKHKVQMKLYHEQHKDHHKVLMKQYRDQHKEQMIRYRDQHKEQIKIYKSTLIYCQCGCNYTRNNKS